LLLKQTILFGLGGTEVTEPWGTVMSTTTLLQNK
jgi:hypothetical protein